MDKFCGYFHTKPDGTFTEHHKMEDILLIEWTNDFWLGSMLHWDHK